MGDRSHYQRTFGACVPSSHSGASHSNSVATSDRRRTRRRYWRQPTKVAFHAIGENDPWKCDGTLLNLSPDGMACRVADSDASVLEVGGTVLLRFQLAEASPFEFLSRVNNVIGAGTPGQSVVGLEFAGGHSAVSSRTRLRALLDSGNPNAE